MPGTSAAYPPYSTHASYAAAHSSSLQHIHPAIPAMPYAGHPSHPAQVRAPRAGELHLRDGLARGPVGRCLDDEHVQMPEVDGYDVRSYSIEMDGVYARGSGRW